MRNDAEITCRVRIAHRGFNADLRGHAAEHDRLRDEARCYALKLGAAGVLAVAVASPCTAPFMGAALGAALTLPPVQALAVFAALKAREEAARAKVAAAKDKLSAVFWFSSASPSADAYVGGKNSASGFIASVLGGHNAITSETEWPTVSWESIIAANPDVIVVASVSCI